MNNKFLSLLIKTFFISFWFILILIFLYYPNSFSDDKNKKTINVYSWPDFLNYEKILPFEKKTGIKVNVNYYEHNSEILTKLSLTKGEGMDLILITDDTVKKAINKKLLKKIDKSKLNFWQDIKNEFKDLPYDPGAQYSIPYSWDIYGIGYSKNYFKVKPKESWEILFDNKVKHIALINEPFELISIASQYLYGNNLDLSPLKLDKIKKLLIKQKPFVEAYTDLRVDYLLSSGTSPLGVTQSAYMKRAMQDNNNIDFLIPVEGSFLVVDSFVIPAASQSEEVYELINYLSSTEELESINEEFGYLPARESVLKDCDTNYMGDIDKLLSKENFKKFGFFYQTIPESVINRFWIDIKSR